VAPFLRPAVVDDEPFLWAMLYEASHAAEAGLASADELRALPELARYVEHWGRPGDHGIVGGTRPRGPLLGAAWLRVLTGEHAGYGHVDDATPELAIAVAPAARSAGLGTALLTRLLADARALFTGVSLSVRADNPARQLYTRLGFAPVDGPEVTNRSGGTSLTMVLRFTT
jgi:ribosomal protein S18 acetylase RimI-like enzyme